MVTLKRKIANIASVFLLPAIYAKFLYDSFKLGIDPTIWPLYNRIHILTFFNLGRFPNLINPIDFNDKIQWLKMFDQRSLVIKCSDKILVKDYIKERLGKCFYPKTLYSSNFIEKFSVDEFHAPFVVKTNHDSGTVFLVRNINDFDFNSMKNTIENSLNHKYGVYNGEWSYSHIEPKFFFEEYLGDENNPPPPDFKFHCTDGHVCFLQYIYDRGSDTKEVIVSNSGKVLNIHFDQNMIYATNFVIPNEFCRMKEIASVLSMGHKYVRVDMYLVNGNIYVGELTFYPLMGCYRGNGQKILGNLINFDTNSRLPPYQIN